MAKTNGKAKKSDRLIALPPMVGIVQFEPGLDSYRRYVTDSPSPQKFASWLKAADQGDVAAICEMQAEMEAKCAWLGGVMETRRNAVLALEWDVVPDDKAEDQDAAKEAADYCRERLSRIESFPTTLEHLASAYGPNVAVSEIVWGARAEVDGFVDVPGHRLLTRPYEGPGVYIETTANFMGITTDAASYGGQQRFIVFHAKRNAGFPFRSTLTHSLVWPYLIIHFGRTDWSVFSERFGQPIPVAHYDNAVVNVDRTTVNEALDQISSDGRITLPDGITVALLQAQGSGEVYTRLMEWARTEIAVAVLGQTLTTDVGYRGSFAAAKVHDNVRADVLMADLSREARCIEAQVLAPMIAMRFPGMEMPRPKWKRMLKEASDAGVRINQLRAAKESGLLLKIEQVYDALDFSQPSDDDENTWPTEEMKAKDEAEKQAERDAIEARRPPVS